MATLMMKGNTNGVVAGRSVLDPDHRTMLGAVIEFGQTSRPNWTQFSTFTTGKLPVESLTLLCDRIRYLQCFDWFNNVQNNVLIDSTIIF